MRRVGTGKVAAALLLGLAASAGHAQEPTRGRGPTEGGLWANLFGGKPEGKKAAAEGGDAEAKVVDAQAARAQAARAREREWNALFRRQAVCDRLRDVALATGNGDLWRDAEQLEELAWQVYREQTAGLPGPKPATPDERVLGERLGGSAAPRASGRPTPASLHEEAARSARLGEEDR